MRKIKLEPGSNDYMFHDEKNIKVTPSENSKELWVSITTLTCPEFHESGILKKQHPSGLNLDGIERIVVTDWVGAYHKLHDYQIEWVEQLSELRPTEWITMNNYVDTTANWKTYGWCWNRTKAAYTESILGPKYKHVENYVQYPFYNQPRSHPIMSMTRQNYPYRQQLTHFLSEFPNVLVGSIDHDRLLKPTIGSAEDIKNGLTAPPAKKFFDSSYISAQVESQHLGTRGVLFSEKTYDHLIQGRCVLNFGSAGYYQHLMREGWKYPSDLDFGWDSIGHDRHRFQAYLDMLEKLICLPDLHGWFMANRDVWIYNQQMLWNKPYDIIE